MAPRWRQLGVRVRRPRPGARARPGSALPEALGRRARTGALRELARARRPAGVRDGRPPPRALPRPALQARRPGHRGRRRWPPRSPRPAPSTSSTSRAATSSPSRTSPPSWRCTKRSSTSFPDAILEDPHDRPEVAALLEPHAARVSFDAPIATAADIACAAVRRPDRQRQALAHRRLCARCLTSTSTASAAACGCTAAGWASSGSRRGQIELLAALFHPDGPERRRAVGLQPARTSPPPCRRARSRRPRHHGLPLGLTTPRASATSGPDWFAGPGRSTSSHSRAHPRQAVKRSRRSPTHAPLRCARRIVDRQPRRSPSAVASALCTRWSTPGAVRDASHKGLRSPVSHCGNTVTAMSAAITTAPLADASGGGKRLGRQTSLRVTLAEMLASGLGAVDVFLLLWLVLPKPSHDADPDTLLAVNGGAFVVFLLLFGIAGMVWGNRSFARATAWLRGGPRAHRGGALRGPAPAAGVRGLDALGWAVGAVRLRAHQPAGVADLAFHVGATISWAGSRARRSSYLLVERAMRPVTARRSPRAGPAAEGPGRRRPAAAGVGLRDRRAARAACHDRRPGAGRPGGTDLAGAALSVVVLAGIGVRRACSRRGSSPARSPTR